MIEYDPKQPLIFLHMPKCGGTSTMRVFRRWFRKNCILHYYDDKLPGAKDSVERMPERVDLASRKGPVVVYGHFNKRRGFGVEEYYPDVRQFMTILRDPFEMAVSAYNFGRKRKLHKVGETHPLHQDVEGYLMSVSFYMKHFFPVDVTMDNYRDVIDTMFVHVGDVDRLPQSLTTIARKLGQPFTAEEVERLNVSERKDGTPDHLRAAFREKWPLEHAIYEYAMEAFPQDELPAAAVAKSA